MSEMKLPPCPFCGGESKHEFNEAAGVWDVWCDSCGAQPYAGRKKEYEAIEEWNTRAERTCRTGEYMGIIGLGTIGHHYTCEHDGTDYAMPFRPTYCPLCGGRVEVE